MSETVQRYLLMLQCIPRQPRATHTGALVEKLAEHGIRISQRSVQRDLEKLEAVLPLHCDSSDKPYRWFWAKDAELFHIPSLDPQSALTLELVSRFLKPVLPRSVLGHLEPYFDRARNVLQQLPESKLSAWPPKVRVLGRGQPLSAPSVRHDVIEAVYTALLEERQFEAGYRRRGETETRRYVVNPLGLAFRDALIYLVCTFWDYDDVNHLVLHRMTSAKLLDERRRIPALFNLDAHINSGALGFPLGEGTLRLVAVFDPAPAVTLRETALSKDQKLVELAEGSVQVEATVADTMELRAWLRSYGDLVEVLEPKELRDELRSVAERMLQRYKQGTKQG